MIEWPFCPIHHEPMQLVCVGGNWQYVCPACNKTPLTYSVATEKEEEIPIIDIEHAPTIGGWISVKDRMPESGKHVLVTCEIRFLNGYKRQYVCEAYHAEEHSISEGKYQEDKDCYDYNEEDDEYYLKEGWYEVIHNWDEYSSVIIGDFVTHWMPLPEPPKEEENDD